MLKLTELEITKIQQESRKKLESIVRGIFKRPGEDVPDNNVLYVLNSIEKNGYFSIDGITIKGIYELCEYEYDCEDGHDLEFMLKEFEKNIVKRKGKHLTIRIDLTTDYIVEGTGNIFEVVTSQEASEMLGLTEGAIRKAIKSGRLVLGRDYRKAGRITLINKDSLKIFEKEN